MTSLLFSWLVIALVATLVCALAEPHRFYWYPALCALTILGWVVPQLVVLLDFPDLPSGALPLTLLMILLCFLAILAGWWRGGRARAWDFRAEFDVGRLLIGAVALTLIGTYFRIRLYSLPDHLLEMGAWSGPQTIYIFFARMQMLAFALCWLLFLRYRSTLALGIAAFNLLFFLDRIFIGGRRATILEVGFILLAGLWLCRGWAPPRIALIAGAGALVILFNAIGEYRFATRARQALTDPISIAEAWENIKGIDWLAAANPEDRDPRQLELYNATLVIAATQERRDFEWIGNYWDSLVFRYVPGQLVGFGLKESLMFNTTDPMLEVYGVQKHAGTTRTGFADAFRSFWLFGALVFFGFAWLMRVCWERAITGDLLFQFLYLILMKDALHAITHSTSRFVVFWPYVVIFAGPVFWFACRGWTAPRARPGLAGTDGRSLRSLTPPRFPLRPRVHPRAVPRRGNLPHEPQ